MTRVRHLLERASLAAALMVASGALPLGATQVASAGGALDAGPTGWEARRPVMAAACPHACPWGELGDFVAEAMAPLGYEVILCRNCNRDRGPRLVSTAALPPELDALDARVGTTTRVDAPVDFGVTAAGILSFAASGAYANLRLVANIEDPTYLLVAVRAESGITDLGQIRDGRLPVTILAGGGSGPVLEHYGITAETLASWGGSLGRAMGAGRGVAFDVIVDDLGSPAMNPESSQWPTLSQAFDLRFLDLPEGLLEHLAREPDYQRVIVKWGLLRGVDREIPTVGRSGEVVFARADTPDQAAYDLAMAIDEHRAALRWFVRPYSYDPDSVWRSQAVPLHPGAERYYRERGYIR